MKVVQHPLSLLMLAQKRVIEALCKGMTDAEIATTLGITTQTVRNHLRLIYARFGIHRRTELRAYLRPIEN